jgi:hypothetical protein
MFNFGLLPSETPLYIFYPPSYKENFGFWIFCFSEIKNIHIYALLHTLQVLWLVLFWLNDFIKLFYCLVSILNLTGKIELFLFLILIKILMRFEICNIWFQLLNEIFFVIIKCLQLKLKLLLFPLNFGCIKFRDTYFFKMEFSSRDTFNFYSKFSFWNIIFFKFKLNDFPLINYYYTFSLFISTTFSMLLPFLIS